MVRENGSEMAPVSPKRTILNVYLKKRELERTLDFDTYVSKRGRCKRVNILHP